MLAAVSCSSRRIRVNTQARIQSYASRSQLAVSAAERNAAIELEWDRLLITTLGVANKRLYECRLQSDISVPEDVLVSNGCFVNCIKYWSCNSHSCAFHWISWIPLGPHPVSCFLFQARLLTTAESFQCKEVEV